MKATLKISKAQWQIKLYDFRFSFGNDLLLFSCSEETWWCHIFFFYALAMMVASQGGRHHCECNDPEIFQTTLSARQACSCLSHYQRVINQSDSQIHSETECTCSQTPKMKQQKEKVFCCYKVDWFSQLWLYCPRDFQSQLSKLSRLGYI